MKIANSGSRLQAISLPEDVQQLERLNGTMVHLLTATDSGVAQAAQLVRRALSI